jgi:peptidyl-prolyl cis-trans isomerase C
VRVLRLGRERRMVNGAYAGDSAVMAKVDGQDITEADLALAEVELGNELGTLPPATKRRVLVEYLIETKLFAAAAEADKLAQSPEFEARAAYWRRRALRDEFFEKSIKGSISDALAKGIYEDKVKMLPAEEEVEARHILVASEDKIKELAEQIDKGGDFAQLAKDNSTDPGSKDNGGSLGYFTKGQMVAEFDQAAFALKPGEVSKPVKSKFGWHLIKVDDRRQKKPPTFEEVKPHIVGSMAQNKAQEVATTLRGKANIEYVDPDIKKMAQEDAAKAAVQKKLLEDKMEEQIKSMDGDKK